MSVRKRAYCDPETGAVRKVWVVDVDFVMPDGTRVRVRKKSPVQTQRGAEQYEQRVRAALLNGTYGKETRRQVPTLQEFQSEYLSNQAKVHDKPSAIASKESILKNHLVPRFG